MTDILAVGAFVIGISFNLIAGRYAYLLANHINYKGSHISLFINAISHVLNNGDIDYDLKDERSLILFKKLKRTIKIFCYTLLPYGLVTFTVSALSTP